MRSTAVSPGPDPGATDAGTDATGLRLGPAPTGWTANTVAVWPTRVCLRAGPSGAAELVAEQDCGCNESLVCTVARAGDALRVELHTRGDDALTCEDCFPMRPGVCALPTLDPGRYAVSIHGVWAFTFLADPAGRPPLGECWSARAL